MKLLLFTPEMKLADVIHTNYRLLLILSRFRINLGFGDKTVEECCCLSHISPELFLMICNVYTFENYLPGKKEISQIDVQGLVDYLKSSHSYYLNCRIQSIEDQLKIISENTCPQHPDVLKRFFEEYKKEVIHHFNYEEETVFPYILNIPKDKEGTNYHIEIFEQNHTNIDDKLNDMKNIIIKYLPGGSFAEEKNQLLFNIFSLEEDLNRHTLIEDKILIPFVQKLESRYGKQ